MSGTRDDFRTKAEVKLFCAKHPKQELRFSGDSKVGASSAYEINLKIVVHPCWECEREIEQIKGVIRIFNNISQKE